MLDVAFLQTCCVYCCLCWFVFVVDLFVRPALRILCVSVLLCTVCFRVVLLFVFAFVLVAVVLSSLIMNVVLLFVLLFV